MLKEGAGTVEFFLFGGPLHRLGRRFGLVRSGGGTLWLGVALGLMAWSVLVVLALLEGLGHRIFSLTLIGVHVRLLLAIPLLFSAERWLALPMAEFVRYVVRAGIVSPSARPALEVEIVRATRLQASWLPDALCLLVASLLPLAMAQLDPAGASGAYDPGRAVAPGTRASQWYWIVCLPLFRFLMLRWIWRLGVWSHFLWRLAHLDLHLVPTHPDGAGGLGYLEVVHIQFVPLILGLSAVHSASLAEEIAAGAMTFEAAFPPLAVVLIVVGALFLGPLSFFFFRLKHCREKGLSDYMEFAQRYVSGFDGKWLRTGDPPGEPLLGTADLQSLADLSNSVAIVRNMRLAPVSLKLIRSLAIAALLPALPLLLLKYPVAELTLRFVTRLAGL